VQRLGVLCGCCAVLSKQARVWLGVGCYARIRCGFPVDKAFLWEQEYRSGGLAVGISGCGAGAVPSKQAKQTSKGLVFGAVWVLSKMQIVCK